MSIGIEHKLKGYLSRIEKIKADGTREVISADIEVPNTIVNLGRRMVSGEWLHRFAGDDIPSSFKKGHIFSIGGSPSSMPGIGMANEMNSSGANQYINVYNSSDRNISQTYAQSFSKICFPGSYLAISSDGRDTSLSDEFKDYTGSLIENSSGNASETNLLYRCAASGYNWYEGARVYTDFNYVQSDDSVDIMSRVTLRSIAVNNDSVVRSILLCGMKQNITYPDFIPNNDNQPKLFSRIVLPEPISLEVGERLMITYDFHIIVNKAEVLGSMNGINYSIRPYIRGRQCNYSSYGGRTCNYFRGGGAARLSNGQRAESWVNPSTPICEYFAVNSYSFPSPPLFLVDDLRLLLSNWVDSNTNNWKKNFSNESALTYLTCYQAKSGILTSTAHSRDAVKFDSSTSSSTGEWYYTYNDPILADIPCNANYRNIVFQNYPGCPETMMRGLDWQLTPDGKATFESCYAIQPTAGAMNIYGLLAHGAIVCFGKYDENGTWVDEPIVKSATQKAMISLKTIWNFD